MIKKNLLALLIVSSSLYSQDSKESTTLTQNSFIQKYKQALELFKNKDYPPALALFEELFEIKSNNLNINFYLGRTAYETQQYDVALRAYERFLFEEPDNPRVKIELSKTYIIIKVYKEAKKLLLEVKNDPTVPLETLNQVDIYLKIIDENIKKYSLSGMIMGGINYDSNINNRSFNTYFTTSILDDIPNSTEDKSAWGHQEIGMINYNYKISDTSLLKNNFMILNKNYFNGEYNKSKKVLFLSYSPSLNITYTPKLDIDYGLYFDKLRYAGEDFVKSFAFIPKINYIYNDAAKITTSFKYQIKDNYAQTSVDQVGNARFLQLHSALTYKISKSTSIIPSLTFENEKKLSGGEDKLDVDYDGIEFGIASKYLYTKKMILQPSIYYKHSQYNETNPSTTDGGKELKKTLSLALSATYVHSPLWIFQSGINYTKQHSNVQANEYNKHTFGINIIRTF